MGPMNEEEDDTSNDDWNTENISQNLYDGRVEWETYHDARIITGVLIPPPRQVLVTEQSVAVGERLTRG